MFEVKSYSMCDEDSACQKDFSDGLFDTELEAINHVKHNAAMYEYIVCITNTDTGANAKQYRFEDDCYGYPQPIEVNSW